MINGTKMLMKKKILNLLLIVTSLFGYLEWGKNSSLFLLMAEWEILKKIFTDPLSVLHPLVVLPLIGQILLLVTLFQKEPGKKLTYIGFASIAILFLLMLFIGVIDFNIKILASTLPFLSIGVYTIFEHRKK